MEVRSIAEAQRLLQDEDWEGARRLFEASLREREDADALDGLGRALWWLGRLDESLAVRERAFVGFRRRGDLPRAVGIAIWLAREYAAVHRNHSAANGWLTRARGMLEAMEPGPEHGRLQLLRAERSTDPTAKELYAEAALDIARRYGDADCEIHALALRGLARVQAGEAAAGVADLDQAMAAAVAGEGSDPQTLGDAFCTMVGAAELLGEFNRFSGWAEIVEKRMGRSGHVPLLSFCRACCGELFAATGRWEAAERELVAALEMLETSGHRARCVEPAARLARLRIRQGRLEQAEELVARYTDEPEMVPAHAELLLARDNPAGAARSLERRLHHTGDQTLDAVPLLALLVEAELGRGNAAAARAAAARIRSFGKRSGMLRVIARADRAAGRLAMAGGDVPGALGHLERALEVFRQKRMRYEAARTRLDIASTLAASEPEAAATEARTAVQDLDRLGAKRDADAASALLRSLGVRGRPGPRNVGTLSARETEVLRLLRYGLSNAEIGERLYISPRTAGHHVSSILRKLEVRTRTEAATLAEGLLRASE